MPACFRDRLKDLPVREASRFALVVWHGDYIRILPAFVWEQELERVTTFLESTAHALSIDEEDRIRSFYFGSSIEVQIDNFGRFVLPRDLREQCGIKNDVVWDAAGSYIKLLAPEKFARASESREQTRAACDLYHAQSRQFRIAAESASRGETRND